MINEQYITDPGYRQEGFSSKVLRDSISPEGKRITTVELILPRVVLAELNTHGRLAKNGASSRAIPFHKQIEKVLNHPFIPERIGYNMPGMQAKVYLEGAELEKAQQRIVKLLHRNVISVFELILGQKAVKSFFPGETYYDVIDNGFDEKTRQIATTLTSHVKLLLARQREDEKFNPGADYINLHKQTINRYLEPFMWQTEILTFTESDNFFALRNHADADPVMHLAAFHVYEAMAASTPKQLKHGEWHLPLLNDKEYADALSKNPQMQTLAEWISISSGRCARTSAETHAGVRDTAKDIMLASDLRSAGHMSPFEHQARPLEEHDDKELQGRFVGWVQNRKEIPYEENYALLMEQSK